MRRQQDILNDFRKGKIDYYDIPMCYEEYGIDGLEDDVGQKFSALQVLCTIEEWCLDTSITMKGVVVHPSSNELQIGVPEGVLRLLQREAINTDAFQGGIGKHAVAVYDVTKGRMRRSHIIEKHRLNLEPGTFIWYDVGCMSIARQEVDIMLKHPLVKQFLE